MIIKTILVAAAIAFMAAIVTSQAARTRGDGTRDDDGPSILVTVAKAATPH